MEPRLVVVHDVQVRHAYREIDSSRIVRDVEEDEGLSRAHVAVLDALADHEREELGDDSCGECPGREGEALTVLVDYVTFRPNFRLETRGDLVDAQLVRRLVFDSERRTFWPSEVLYIQNWSARLPLPLALRRALGAAGGFRPAADADADAAVPAPPPLRDMCSMGLEIESSSVVLRFVWLLNVTAPWSPRLLRSSGSMYARSTSF